MTLKIPKFIQKMEHYRSREDRRWKRVWNTCGLIILMIACGFSSGVVLYYGNGKNLQSAFLLFALPMFFCIASLVPTMYQNSSNLRRWQISVIKLGFACATGLAALSAFFIIEMQRLGNAAL